MKNSLNRRQFMISAALAGSTLLSKTALSEHKKETIQTVTGKISASRMGITLIHEHILVDFIGAKEIHPGRWNHDQVIEKVLPYLLEVSNLGCRTLVECTPSYLGKDPLLLKKLSEKSGLQLLTNTGYYGAVNNKFLPDHALTESAEQLAKRWIKDFEEGINQSGVRPGFIKISVETGSLSELHQKLVRAAALTHLSTGLAIASHTLYAVPAFEQIKILKENGVSPEAFIWVHAQAEKDKNTYLEAAREGTWISLDGVNEKEIESYVEMLSTLKEKGYLNKVLISHDAGWYDPAKEKGGEFKPYTAIFNHLIPALEKKGLKENEVRQLMIENPAKVFVTKIRKSK